ncbi:MAG TPA: pyrroloquinoline quinone-dependent dehydrogenase [Vicinamibacterales bacterium]|nr:pyrroloquinoline quinone-dependent dehydrogenase [Vicinamibacterales bacterium]
MRRVRWVLAAAIVATAPHASLAPAAPPALRAVRAPHAPLAPLAPLAPRASSPPRAPDDVPWPVNGGVDNIRYSPLTQIDRTNVAQLKVAWSYDSHDAFKGSEMQSNPIVVNGMLYATTPTLKVIALDAATGREVWKFDPAGGAAPGARFRHRGVAVGHGRVFVTYRNWLFALDAKTGQPIKTFGAGGRVDLREGLGRPAEKLTVTASTPGVVFEDLLIMGSTVPETLPSAPGDIRAFDVNTGKIRWSFHTIPHPGEFGYDTWPKDAWQITGGANAWAGVVVDPKLAMVFAATGSASFDFYGANRTGNDLFADCVLALDARTGARIWHFQGLHHDIWDLDFPAAPNLVTVTRGGRKVDAVAQVTKTGFVFVLDRRTGQPLFPIEERAVPSSTMEGEQLSRTQPFPVKPPRFTRSGPTEAMLTRRTPEAHAAVLEQFRKLKSGTFAPPSLEGTIIFPGVDGGAEWGGAAFDPATALLYVNANEMPWIVRLIPNTDTSLYESKCATCHRSDRRGSPAAPTLIDIGKRKSRDQIADIVRHGTGRMPGFPDFGAKNVNDLVEFLITGVDRGKDPNLLTEPTYVKYRSDGETLWRDPDGYPPLTPPWGTLSAIDLDAGVIRWKIPFGEFPELAATGLRRTGSDNYGGPVVTASGLLLIGATNFDRKFHAYEALTGRLLWETTLPAAGNATPAVYAVNGREYVVIVCGGGKNGAPSGSSIVAFALSR